MWKVAPEAWLNMTNGTAHPYRWSIRKEGVRYSFKKERVEYVILNSNTNNLLTRQQALKELDRASVLKIGFLLLIIFNVQGTCC